MKNACRNQKLRISQNVIFSIKIVYYQSQHTGPNLYETTYFVSAVTFWKNKIFNFFFLIRKAQHSFCNCTKQNFQCHVCCFIECLSFCILFARAVFRLSCDARFEQIIIITHFLLRKCDCVTHGLSHTQK